MGIYSRDNINYQGMLQNMLAAKERGAAIRANAMRNQGQMWGDTISGIGNTFGNALIQYGQQSDAADKYADEQSWKAKQFDFQNRQLEQQKLLQEEQMRLSRELQGAQARKEAEYQKDEYMKNWNLANEELKAADSALRMDPNNADLIARRNKAAYTADYWGKKAGVQMPDATVEVPAAPATVPTAEGVPVTQQDQEEIFRASLAGEWTNAKKDQAIAEANKLIDEGKKAAAIAEITKMGMTKEEKIEAGKDAKLKIQQTIDNWQPGSPVPQGFEVYFAGGKQHIRQKGKK